MARKQTEWFGERRWGSNCELLPVCREGVAVSSQRGRPGLAPDFCVQMGKRSLRFLDWTFYSV